MNWKEELINAKEEVIYVKHKRGEGVTATVIEKLLNTDKDISVLYVGNYVVVEDILLKIWHSKDKRIFNLETNYRTREIIVNLTNNKWIKIICTRVEEADENFKRGINFHIGVSDNLDFSMPQIIKRCRQKIIILPDTDLTSFRLINSDKIKEENKELTLDKRIENYKKELFNELEGMPMNDKTTMTRERIISMIRSLDQIRK